MSATQPNSLISTKPSDSNLSIALHPLILLTVSDQITRHRVRSLPGPIVGAVLGQQKGREITAEHAFPCSVIENTVGHWILDQEWMERRIQQYKDVHKVPILDIVGWFTLCAESGPSPDLVQVQKQFVTLYNDNAFLLAIHPDAIDPSAPSGANARLPLTIYESISETDQVKEEGSMQVDEEDGQDLKFRPLPYSIETDETEMIAIDYVAKGAGSAAAVVTEQPPSPGTIARAEKKGKKRADASEIEKEPKGPKLPSSTLSVEEEDLIAGLTTRLNSIRMLQSRLSLLSQFLQSLPPSYLSNSSIPLDSSSPEQTHLPHLRNIQALLTRLSLLTPATQSSSDDTLATIDPLSMAIQSQSNDVALSSLLSWVGQDIQAMSEMGRKFAAVEHQKGQKSKGKGGPGGGFDNPYYEGVGDDLSRVGPFGLSGSMLV